VRAGGAGARARAWARAGVRARAWAGARARARPIVLPAQVLPRVRVLGILTRVRRVRMRVRVWLWLWLWVRVWVRVRVWLWLWVRVWVRVRVWVWVWVRVRVRVQPGALQQCGRMHEAIGYPFIISPFIISMHEAIDLMLCLPQCPRMLASLLHEASLDG